MTFYVQFEGLFICLPDFCCLAPLIPMFLLSDQKLKIVLLFCVAENCIF